jgi:hypothetical protein
MAAFVIDGRAADAIESAVSEAVIAEARRRQRRRRLALAALAVAVAAAYVLFGHPGIGASSGAGAAAHTSSPSRVTPCLQRHSILVSPVSSGSDFAFAPALSVSFALVPGQRLDNATVFFEHSSAQARGVVSRLVRRFRTKAPSVRFYFTVAGNVIALWGSPHPAAASKATLRSCL